MHVCMVLPDFYPPDVRVAKEASTLLGAGHEVTLLCRGRADQPREAVVDGVSVVRLGPRTRRARAALLASAAANLVANVQVAWVRELDRLVRTRDVDAVHVHDLPLVKEGLRVGDRHGLPVVADLHENYPAAVRQWRKPHQGPGLLGRPALLVRQAFLPAARWRRVERAVVPRADHVLAVVDEAKAHYVEDCGVAPEDVTVVSNTVDRGTFDPDAVDPVDLGEEFVATYVGGFGPHRGLETAVRAVGRVSTAHARLVLVGAGPGTYECRLRAVAAEVGAADRVELTGWVDFEDVPGYVAGSDACLVPHAANPHTDTTVPHKLFQYMAMERPVVVTDVDPLERIVGGTGAGHVVPAEDPAAMARALDGLATDPEAARERGANGRRAVARQYNWARDGERLRSVYDDLA